MLRRAEAIRAACSEDLFELADRLIADGASLTRIAGKVAASNGTTRQAGDIRRYLTREQSGAASVRTITRAFVEISKQKTRPGVPRICISAQ